MDESEAQHDLTPACDHHCGVITTGKTKHIGHCDCYECHGYDEVTTNA